MDTLLQEESTPVNSIYLALVQCFVIILCGYIAGRLNVIRKSEANGLNTFVGTFSLPALIFLSLAKLDFSIVNWKFLVAILIAKSVVFITVLIVSLLTTRPSNPGRSALFAIFTTQSNDFAIGYPLVKALYGNEHPEYAAYLYLLAPISLAILNPIGFVFLEIGKRQTEHQRSKWQMLAHVLKGVALNPVLVMTVFGICGNFIFDHIVPAYINSVLEVFSNAFSASALFLLGLMMVGKVHKLKGVALVIPGILISIKLLILPLIIRESVYLLNAGTNITDTADLSTFGFLYGTIPTAPALFIFTLRYNIDIDLIASAMVVCTFLSAPLMFVSAKLISAVSSGVTPIGYSRDLEAFSLDISAISVGICIWLIIYFLVVERSKFQTITHRCTFCLVIAQLAASTGVIVWTKLDNNDVGSILWYTQYILIATGIYASRLWTVAIAIVILFLSSQNYSVLQNLFRWFLLLGWGVPVIIVSITCLFLKPKTFNDNELKNPNFQFGRVQTAISILLLVFVFVVTIGCLIMQQRYRRQNGSYSQANLISQTSPVPTPVIDVEDLVPSTSQLLPNGECLGGLCEEGRGCMQEIDNEIDNFISEDNKYQILQHLVLLILLLCSMFVGLSVSVGSLIMEEVTGIYAMLAFLDVTLCFGQSFIIFAIFGIHLRLERLGCWLHRLSQKLYSEAELKLPNEDALSDEAKEIRDQFKRCYLATCRNSIAACRRRLLKVYKEVFTGKDFVNWVINAGLANDREEAERYGKCLLDCRVLYHVDGTQHFYDKNLLYSFRL